MNHVSVRYLFVIINYVGVISLINYSRIPDNYIKEYWYMKNVNLYKNFPFIFVYAIMGLNLVLKYPPHNHEQY